MILQQKLTLIDPLTRTRDKSFAKNFIKVSDWRPLYFLIFPPSTKTQILPSSLFFVFYTTKTQMFIHVMFIHVCMIHIWNMLGREGERKWNKCYLMNKNHGTSCMYVCYVYWDTSPLCYASTDAYLQYLWSTCYHEGLFFYEGPVTCIVLCPTKSSLRGTYINPSDGSTYAYVGRV